MLGVNEVAEWTKLSGRLHAPAEVDVLRAALIEMMTRHGETECYVLKPDMNRYAERELEIMRGNFGTTVRLK